MHRIYEIELITIVHLTDSNRAVSMDRCNDTNVPIPTGCSLENGTILESTGLVVGSKIVLPGGVLPLTERPEYVPVYSYSYYGSASEATT